MYISPVTVSLVNYNGIKPVKTGNKKPSFGTGFNGLFMKSAVKITNPLLFMASLGVIKNFGNPEKNEKIHEENIVTKETDDGSYFEKRDVNGNIIETAETVKADDGSKAVYHNIFNEKLIHSSETEIDVDGKELSGNATDFDKNSKILTQSEWYYDTDNTKIIESQIYKNAIMAQVGEDTLEWDGEFFEKRIKKELLLPNGIKSITEEKYNAQNVLTEKSEIKSTLQGTFDEIVKTFDESGKSTSKKLYEKTSDGKIISVTDYFREYDKDGNLKADNEVKSESGKKTEKRTIYATNPNGKVFVSGILTVVKSSDGKIMQKSKRTFTGNDLKLHIWTYDEKGRTRSELVEKQDASGISTNNTEYFYDKKGKKSISLCSNLQKDKDGNDLYISLKEFNQNNVPVYSSVKKYNPEIKGQYETAETRSDFTKQNGKKLFETETKTVVYPDGSQETETNRYEFLSKNQKAVTFYDKTQKDADGNVVYFLKYYYNKDGSKKLSVEDKFLTLTDIQNLGIKELKLDENTFAHEEASYKTFNGVERAVIEYQTYEKNGKFIGAVRAVTDYDDNGNLTGLHADVFNENNKNILNVDKRDLKNGIFGTVMTTERDEYEKIKTSNTHIYDETGILSEVNTVKYSAEETEEIQNKYVFDEKNNTYLIKTKKSLSVYPDGTKVTIFNELEPDISGNRIKYISETFEKPGAIKQKNQNLAYIGDRSYITRDERYFNGGKTELKVIRGYNNSDNKPEKVITEIKYGDGTKVWNEDEFAYTKENLCIAKYSYKTKTDSKGNVTVSEIKYKDFTPGAKLIESPFVHSVFSGTKSDLFVADKSDLQNVYTAGIEFSTEKTVYADNNIRDITGFYDDNCQKVKENISEIFTNGKRKNYVREIQYIKDGKSQKEVHLMKNEKGEPIYRKEFDSKQHPLKYVFFNSNGSDIVVAQYLKPGQITGTYSYLNLKGKIILSGKYRYSTKSNILEFVGNSGKVLKKIQFPKTHNINNVMEYLSNLKLHGQ